MENKILLEFVTELMGITQEIIEEQKKQQNKINKITRFLCLNKDNLDSNFEDINKRLEKLQDNWVIKIGSIGQKYK